MSTDKVTRQKCNRLKFHAVNFCLVFTDHPHCSKILGSGHSKCVLNKKKRTEIHLTPFQSECQGLMNFRRKNGIMDLFHAS